MTYDGRFTNSDLLNFNPTREASLIPFMSINKIYVMDGEIMTCYQIFSKVTKFREMAFENKVCLYKKGDT